jgi:hypothetical protein
MARVTFGAHAAIHFCVLVCGSVSSPLPSFSGKIRAPVLPRAISIES